MVTKIIMGLLLKLLLDQAFLFKMYSEIKRKKDKKPFVIRQLRLKKIGILSYFLPLRQCLIIWIQLCLFRI